MMPLRSLRPWLLATAFCSLALLVTTSFAAEVAPAPHQAVAKPEIKTPIDLDDAIMAEIKNHTEIMNNLQYLSDVIGPRLTGSKNLDRANHWTEEKMKAYGLVNVHLEPWEVPVGWERGRAYMKVIEPETSRELTVASWAWTPGTKGKVIGDVVIVKAKNKDELQAYKGKLKNAVVMTSAPQNVKAITDLNYPGLSLPAAKDAPKEAPKDAQKEAPKVVPKLIELKKDPPVKPGGCEGDEEQPQPPKEQPKKDDVKKVEAKKDDQPPMPKGGGRFGGFDQGFRNDMMEFFKSEGVACTVKDSGKPHGLLNMSGSWPNDRAAAVDTRLPDVVMSHDHYAMLYRLASRPDAVTKVELEIDNKFVPGPITVYNTVGEVLGSEKPDEVVVVGAHLDSWDLGSGTTDNGTGSCVVLETARTIADLAAKGIKPKRTIRFILFTGEEEGLVGSRKYVERHKDEMNKISGAIVHDTGTGKVIGFALHGYNACKPLLEKELTTISKMEGWRGLDLGSLGGSDHQSFDRAGVPGFAARQDMDEYRLTHHSQSDTFDKAKEPNLVQGAQVMAITAMRIANLPEMLPRK
jgi:carboxypeptidase Q